MTTAVVVGSGPNGLAAAVTLAMAGVDVDVIEAEEEFGGGLRTSESTIPGLLHDDCAAVHTMAAASAFLNSLPLAEHGLEWAYPAIDVAHPLDGGRAAAIYTSVDRTAAGLGEDGRAWRWAFGRTSRDFDRLASDLFGPLIRVPRHPVAVANFGIRAAAPASWLARLWRTEQARALFGGVAAHAIHPLTRPMSSSVGAMIISAGHAYGWPVAKGGSKAIADALVSLLRAHGVRIETGRRVESLAELGNPDLVLLDLEPGAVARLAGPRLPRRVASAYRSFRRAPAAFKLDLAVDGGIPWSNPLCREAGTVHLGGGFDELRRTEREISSGRMPERPFVLVAQQYLADPSRSKGTVHPVYAYAHVPYGYPGDATQAILDQFERFAPGTRERIVAMSSRSVAQLEAHDANYVGGDIITGRNDMRQLLFRPRIALDPYSTGIPGVYICSAATPPGAGAHGIGGHNAAKSALNYLRRR